MDKFSDYKNKLFSVLGDSISTFEGCSVPKNAAFYDEGHKLASEVLTASDTWWGQVIDFLSGELLVNNSISGSTVCWHPLYKIPIYACSDERTSSLDKDGRHPDVIMVYIGTNDWRCGFRVHYDERYDCTEDNPSLFLSAYRQMLQKLRTNYPLAEIWCFTLPVSRYSANADFTFPYYYGGRHISEYCEAIRVCAEEYHCRVVDLSEIVEAYDTVDGFHPNVHGMKTIADAVIVGLSADHK